MPQGLCNKFINPNTDGALGGFSIDFPIGFCWIMVVFDQNVGIFDQKMRLSGYIQKYG